MEFGIGPEDTVEPLHLETDKEVIEKLEHLNVKCDHVYGDFLAPDKAFSISFLIFLLMLEVFNKTVHLIYNNITNF